jgi:TDG/mug DNA glycosylase family protein
MTKSNLKSAIDKDTRLIILGTFPSVQSRGVWYYHNPKNQFWIILSRIFNNADILSANSNESLINKRKNFLKNQQIGLWDMIESCNIKGSDDNSIKNPKYNDISTIKKKCPNLECIAFSSKKAFQYYEKYLKLINDDDTKNWLNKMTNNGKNVLPSPSPANARMKLDEKKRIWENILQVLK